MSSLPEYRHQLLSQTEDSSSQEEQSRSSVLAPIEAFEIGVDNDDEDYEVYSDAVEHHHHHHPQQQQPQQHSNSHNHKDMETGGDAGAGAGAATTTTTVTTVTSVSLSPIMNMILDQEEKRKRRFGESYQHVLGDDYHDEDDEVEGDLSHHLDGIKAIPSHPTARFWACAAVVVLLIMLMAAVLLVPNKQQYRNSNSGKNSANPDDEVVLAKSCRTKLFPETHSWQDFLQTMSSTSNEVHWCWPEFYSSEEEGKQEETCPCRNRLEPMEHEVEDAEDEAIYISNVQENQQQLTQFINQSQHPLDVLFAGDDLVERWHGRSYGILQKQGPLYDNAQLFTRYFGGGMDGEVMGLGCGITKDQVPNLLYRLTAKVADKDGSTTVSSKRTGWLDLVPPIEPSIWWIVIGHNDILLVPSCHYAGILAGIIQAVTFIRQARPHATIVLNSLLPPYDTELWTATVQPLNQALACYAAGQYDNRVEFINVTSLFWSENARNETLFEDNYSIHPTTAGYEAWSRVVVQKVKDILHR